MGCVQNSFSCFGQLSSQLVANVGRCLLSRSSLNGRISLSRTPVSQKVAKIVNVIISTAHFEKRLNSLPRRSGWTQQILEPSAGLEPAACRLRIAFNPNEPKPPTLSPSKIKDLTVGGFGVFRLIFDGLMEL